MIQRIQTIYLLIAAIFAGVIALYVSFPIGNENSNNLIGMLNDERLLIKSIGIGFFLSSALAIFSIFKFKNRKNQFVIGRVNILINFYLLGVLLMESLNLPGETTVSEKGIGIFIPLIVIVFLAMANKAIKKDENLVKSADRLR